VRTHKAAHVFYDTNYWQTGFLTESQLSADVTNRYSLPAAPSAITIHTAILTTIIHTDNLIDGHFPGQQSVNKNVRSCLSVLMPSVTSH